MRPDQASAWYRRMSAVYALGTWSVLGALIFTGRRKKSKAGGDKVEQKDVSTSESPESSVPYLSKDQNRYGLNPNCDYQYSRHGVQSWDNMVPVLECCTGLLVASNKWA
ncbi:small integral membrane protein 26 isoform X2 [Eptesicus fuscus]|uniref:small integral membrane protein 26 isoform X2 n=1 Tax=Eptesicus fuscus TaxID=29078 RepID=UPI002403E54F|nr:small integral membrane protein 26 isoform X2 [Eptesicus fuscus]